MQSAAIASPPAEHALDVVDLGDGVFVHQGRHADLDDPARSDSANIGFIVGTKCVAVIDTGGAITTGRALRAAIRERSQLPVCYVFNTHVHFDHMLGNAAFVDDAPAFIGHENLSAAVEGNREFFSEQFSAELEGGGPTAIIAPTATVSGEGRFDIGDRTLVVTAHEPAHTDTDLTVYDERTGTLWAGDLVFMERLPILDGSLRGWLGWIERAAGAGYARTVPGHGPVSAGWPDAVSAQRDYLATLLRDARAAVADGVFLEDAMETMSRKAASEWRLNERHSRNVSKAYREVEWE